MKINGGIMKNKDKKTVQLVYINSNEQRKIKVSKKFRKLVDKIMKEHDDVFKKLAEL